MSTAERFLKAEAGKQSAFETAATPDFKLPFQGSYRDESEEFSAEYDNGTWTPTEIVEQVSTFARVEMNGTAFYELLPVFLSAGFADLTPGGAGPYTYDYELNPAAVGAPSPYTFLLGGNEAIGGTGPAVKIQDCYLENLTLAGNMNSKEVSLRSRFFGSSVNDNSGAGFAFQSAALPTTPEIITFLSGQLAFKDAGATGSSFASMTSLDCDLLDWQLIINAGLQAKWSGDGNQYTYCGIVHGPPMVEFRPVIVTDSTTYALIKGKAAVQTYQECQLTLNGSNSRQVKWQMTGRFQRQFSAHDRRSNEVVMTPTFICRTPYTQTTTPHLFGWELDTRWSHT